ncbi:MAG: radical SAM protein, partial [Anaerohalosphaera sp.]|nr:radical SAM protein [Anaerohalosphaera sp.]
MMNDARGVDKGSRCLAPSFLPGTAVLEMTYQCNHKCVFCSCPWYNESLPFEELKEMSSDQWKGLITKLCGMGVCNLAFTGGEPLLKDGIEGIIEHAAGCMSEHIETENGTLVSRSKMPNLFLLTNGLVMRDDILKLCKKYSINLSMSLPGVESFCSHTCASSASHVLNWFGKAKSLGVTTTAGITVTKQNIDELFETISHALIAGADNILLNRFMPGGRGMEYAGQLSLTVEQIGEMLDIAEEVLEKADRYGSLGTEVPKCVVPDKDKYKRIKVSTGCSAAREFFVVGPSGYIRVCNHSPQRLDHCDQIENLKKNDYWRRFVMKDYIPAQCSGCEHLIDCVG